MMPGKTTHVAIWSTWNGSCHPFLRIFSCSSICSTARRLPRRERGASRVVKCRRANALSDKSYDVSRISVYIYISKWRGPPTRTTNVRHGMIFDRSTSTWNRARSETITLQRAAARIAAVSGQLGCDLDLTARSDPKRPVSDN
uniref:Uncharacterized protein n=1 Tax=Hyaloperonospora arabidopsidis (strain Emoy2) TaxID=559515 RepID=M4BE09_HYAAE